MSIARNVATVGSATLISRVLGFARDMAIAAVFGAGARADAFFVAFQLANLMRRLLAEGAFNPAVIPLYLRARDESGPAGAAAFAGRLIGTFLVALTGLAAVLALVMPGIVFLLAPGFEFGSERATSAIAMARLMLPYMIFAAPVAVMVGVLNANHRFAVAAYVTTALNLTMLAALALVFWLKGGDSDWSAGVIAMSVAVAGVSQLALVAAGLASSRLSVTPIAVAFDKDMRRFLKLAVPGLITTALPQFTVIAGVMIASSSLSAVSWLYYANRLIEMPLGVVSIAIGTVLVPAFTHAVRSGDSHELAHVESRGLELSIGLALPAALALAALAEPVVRILFERGAFTADDTAATAAALAAFALGLPGHVLAKTLSPVFFAREDTGTPMRAAFVGLVVAIGGSLLLRPSMGHVGIALAIALSGWASALLLGILIARRFGFGIDAQARRRLPRIVIAAVVMGLAVLAGLSWLAPWLGPGAHGVTRVVALAVLVAAGLAVYLVLLTLFRVTSPHQLWQAVRRPA